MPLGANGKFNINPAQAKMSAPVADPAADPAAEAPQQILISKNPDGTYSAGDPAAPDANQSFASCDEALAAAKASLDGEPDGDESGMVDSDNDGDEKDSDY